MESAPLPPTTALPSPSRICGRMLSFLNHHFKTQQDLFTVPSLFSELKRECSDLDRNLEELMNKLSLAASDWISCSNEVTSMLCHHLDACCSLSPDRNSMMDYREKRILSVDLPILAKQVARIETVRLYAETTLKLEVLVGDLEDATFSFMNQTSRNNSFNLSKASNTSDIVQEQANLLLAIKAMNQIEEVLVGVTRGMPHWTHLLMAVDARVEKALGILRPQVLSNHRILLASLGWPPSLSTSNIKKGKYMEIPNPLLLMQGEKKDKYSQSFLELCALQHLEVQRTARQHDLLLYQNEHKSSDSVDIGKKLSFSHGLWSIDELVKPIASRMEYHFSRWSDEPKFIFALVYKTTRDFLDGVENILQPLIDKAALVGCSAKEAWVSAMVKMLSNYIEGQIFPYLVMNYDGSAENMVLNSSWLHLLDLMINFDKKMQALATPGTPLVGQFAHLGLSQAQLLLSIFDEHPNWLQIWAEVELKDAQQKLSLELEDEKAWVISIRQQDGLTRDLEAEAFLLSTREDYKAPLIADSVIKISWVMMERGQSLPSKLLRIQFIRSSATLFLNHFFIFLLQRCQDMDFITAILEDNVLLIAVGSINTARYCESVLQEWNEDISILEIPSNDQHPDSSFFKDENMFLVKLQTDCLVEIVSALLLQFDALSLDYIQGIEQWAREQTTSEYQILEDGNMSVSPEFVEALDMLRDRLGILKLNLNSKDFLDLWRSTAGGLDHFIFSSISLRNVKFSRTGVDQFKADARSLFLVFKPFCARPEAFFPCTSDSLKLLAMNRKDVDHLLQVLPGGKRSEDRLRTRGLFHVSVCQAEIFLKNRMF